MDVIGRPMGGITVRPLATGAEYEACVRLQHEIWGETFTGTVPTGMLCATQRVGGVAAGAFDDDGRLLGFVFGMTGLIDGRLVHWSDILAVRPDQRDRGIGRALKLYQRDALRALNIRTMYWTYDPLVARNAYLNLVNLGARPTEYVVDYYGSETGSTLHGALGTDRFVVEWDETDEGRAPVDGVDAAMADAGSGPVIVNPRDNEGVPFVPDLPADASVRIEIPADITALLDQASNVAHEWRATTRRAFTWYLSRGYRVTGFTTTRDAERCFYTLHSTGT